MWCWGEKVWKLSCLSSVFVSWKFYTLVSWDRPGWNVSHYTMSPSPSSGSQHFARWMLYLIPYHIKWKAVALQQLTVPLCKMMIISQWNSWKNFRQRSTRVKLYFAEGSGMQARTLTNSAAPVNSQVLVRVTFPGSKGCLNTSCSHWFPTLKLLSPKLIAHANLA